MIAATQAVLGAVSGALVGCTLGLVGGGGSILAVPLMLYLVGVRNPHVAIGSSAVAVASNAVTGLMLHARQRTVNWQCGAMFSVAGVFGAFAGSIAGKALDGRRLLFLFALVMIVVGTQMLRGHKEQGIPGARCNRANASRVVAFGLGTGLFSGFFGIGGGFLIVPSLIAATSMPMLNAVGTSLVAVTAFGCTTAISYAASGFVDWPLAMSFIAGGICGGFAGTTIAGRLADTGALRALFACIVLATAVYMLLHN